MNPEHNELETSACDRWLAEVMDGTSRANGGELPPPPAGIGAEERAKVADLLFLDALLTRVHDRDPAGNARRVARVLSSLDEACLDEIPGLGTKTLVPAQGVNPSVRAAPARSARRRWLVSSLSMAAGVAGAGAAWLLSSATPVNAQETVRKAYAGALVLEDRHYRVWTYFGGPSVAPIEGSLFVRGGEKFALHQPTPLGLRFWLGSDGKSSWFIPAIGPVLVSGDSSAPRRWIAERGMEVPFLQITAILRELVDDYELDELPDEPLPRDNARGDWRRVRGTLASQRLLLPRQIDAWVHPETGMVARLILDWKLAGKALGLRRIEFDLVDQNRMPDDWYSAARHHGKGRAVLSL